MMYNSDLKSEVSEKQIKLNTYDVKKLLDLKNEVQKLSYNPHAKSQSISYLPLYCYLDSFPPVKDQFMWT